jgi:hypothetical protein
MRLPWNACSRNPTEAASRATVWRGWKWGSKMISVTDRIRRMDRPLDSRRQKSDGGRGGGGGEEQLGHGHRHSRQHRPYRDAPQAGQHPYGSIAVAEDKARSALYYRRPSEVFENLVAQGGLGMRTLALRGASPLEGGIPLIADGKIIGDPSASPARPRFRMAKSPRRVPTGRSERHAPSIVGRARHPVRAASSRVTPSRRGSTTRRRRSFVLRGGLPRVARRHSSRFAVSSTRGR